jgi:hypothetical protein
VAANVRIDTEVFFRPDEVEREATRIRADLFSRCRRALARSVTDCAFVPVRSMQLLAVITRDEIVFVDNLNYAVCEGRGGRLIMLAWDLSRGGQRDSINEPVPVDIVYFHADTRDLHSRLMSEFAPALDRFEQTTRDEAGHPGRAEIIPIRSS